MKLISIIRAIESVTVIMVTFKKSFFLIIIWGVCSQRINDSITTAEPDFVRQLPNALYGDILGQVFIDLSLKSMLASIS